MSSENAPKRREIDYDRLERNKDLAQEAVQSTANRVGRIATIITGAVADVAREIGEPITDGFEMREAAKQAKLRRRPPGPIAADRLADTIEQAEVDELALEAGDAEVEVETD